MVFKSRVGLLPRKVSRQWLFTFEEIEEVVPLDFIGVLKVVEPLGLDPEQLLVVHSLENLPSLAFAVDLDDPFEG